MKPHISRLTALFLLLVLTFASLILPANALGYDAQTARKNFASGEEITNILDYENGDSVDCLFGIYDASGLIRFSDLVNESNSPFRGENFRVYLCASIDMGQVAAFTPIGNGMAEFGKTFPGSAFSGLFDGRGYVIDNLTTALCFNNKGIAYVSLFGCLASHARVQNLVFGSGCRFAYDGNLEKSCAASLAARVEEGAEIKNILNLAPVSGGVFCGGIVARVDGSRDRTENQKAALISNCTNRGSLNGAVAGGLVGKAQGNLTVENCASHGAVTGSSSAGGAVGAISKSLIASGSTEVSATLNHIIVDGTVTGATVDRIVGSTSEITLTQTDCSFSGEKHSEIGVRFHGVQLAEANGRVSIRFIASVDRETPYAEVGFTVSVNQSGREKILSCTKLFPALLGMIDGEIIVYSAESLRGDDGYLFAATIAGITLPNDESIEFTVTPYATGYQSEPSSTLILSFMKGEYTVTWKD